MFCSFIVTYETLSIPLFLPKQVKLLDYMDNTGEIITFLKTLAPSLHEKVCSSH